MVSFSTNDIKFFRSESQQNSAFTENGTLLKNFFFEPISFYTIEKQHFDESLD